MENLPSQDVERTYVGPEQYAGTQRWVGSRVASCRGQPRSQFQRRILAAAAQVHAAPPLYKEVVLELFRAASLLSRFSEPRL